MSLEQTTLPVPIQSMSLNSLLSSLRRPCLQSVSSAAIVICSNRYLQQSFVQSVLFFRRLRLTRRTPHTRLLQVALLAALPPLFAVHDAGADDCNEGGNGKQCDASNRQ
ncbi:MAG: hypothetical protein C0469_14460 [Cyanobacteria bacterium DS2.3.42]|nr:hypothetical protein [Cyanobacteria bacterium DS2.3.42]